MIQRSLALFAVTALALASRAEAASFSREPFVQDVTPTSAVIAFRTDAPCAATVHYGEGSDASRTATDAGGTSHEIRLDGLAAGASHRYVVDACGAQAGASFSAAPAPGSMHVHFAALGDFGDGGSLEKTVAGDILDAHPDLVLALGDNAYENGTESDFQQHLFDPLAPLLAEIPMFASLGNHEYNTDQAKAYINAFSLPVNDLGNERYYSFDYGPVHFVSLDSNCVPDYTATSASCTIEAQKAWLQKDLAATRQPWKIAFFHHPPWSSGHHGSQLLVRHAFGPILEEGGVDLVLNGHDHDYERTVPMRGDDVAPAGTHGITYIVAGMGGAGLTSPDGSQPAWSAFRKSGSAGYLDVDVQGGTLTTQLRLTNGDIADKFTLTKSVDVTIPPNDGTPGGTVQPPVNNGGGGSTTTPPTSGETGSTGNSGGSAAGCASVPVAGALGLLALIVRRKRQAR